MEVFGGTKTKGSCWPFPFFFRVASPFLSILRGEEKRFCWTPLFTRVLTLINLLLYPKVSPNSIVVSCCCLYWKKVRSYIIKFYAEQTSVYFTFLASSKSGTSSLADFVPCRRKCLSLCTVVLWNSISVPYKIVQSLSIQNTIAFSHYNLPKTNPKNSANHNWCGI